MMVIVSVQAEFGKVNKLVSSVADGLHDAVCPLKSFQLFHKTQLPQLECAMLHVRMNRRMHRPSKLRVVNVRQVTVGVAVNKPQVSVPL